ncbi:hypothetical protein IEO21_00166 [Rhodonia placenta]|uniref:Uncharacterized protein n=1 Tax=Rhodonia placenta TaxID=104341 RepID=A0A8H7PC72_9APHY|nr:hypothetical protein IEO21_00166 [Postia placenta]
MKALPRELRKPPPVSVAALKQHRTTDLKRDARKRWKVSPRYAKTCRIDPPI